jgi:hypothetical protein
MLRISIYATLIVILTMAAASAQTDKPGLPGYSNAARTDQEKKNDKELTLLHLAAVEAHEDGRRNDEGSSASENYTGRPQRGA